MRIADLLLTGTLLASIAFAPAASAAGGSGPSGVPQPATRRKIQVRNAETVREILKAAKEPDRSTRSLATWCIALMGREDGMAVLNELATDPAPEVRAAALRALREALPPRTQITVLLSVPVENEILRNEALAAARYLFFAQRDDLIRSALASPIVVDRELAVEALGLDAPEKSHPLLIERVKDSEPAVRAAALRAFAACGDRDAASLIRPLLKENVSPQSFIVRAAACDALGQLKDRDSVKDLLECAGDGHFAVRRAAIGALGNLGEMDTLSTVQAHLGDPDYTVRAAACAVLGALAAPSSPALLVERLTDDMPAVRDAAEAALSRLPADIAAQAVLKNADATENKDLRQRTWRVLAAYGHPDSADMAAQCAEADDPIVKAFALRTLVKLDDRRAVEPAIRTLEMAADKRGPIDPSGQAAYEAATHFKLREPINSTVFMLDWYNSAPHRESPFSPSHDLAMSGIRYVAAIDAGDDAIRAVEAVLTRLRRWDSDRASTVRQILQEWTGKSYPAVVPLTGDAPFFIDVPASGRPE